MQQSNPGALLRGLRESLVAQVLPALPQGVPQQQMKAALHLIGRLERSWDRIGPHLAADNADIAAVLSELLPDDGPDSLSARLLSINVPPIAGINDPNLQAAAQHNLALHQILLDIPHSPAVAALHARMVERDIVLIGDNSNPGNAVR
ncbi:Protein kinase [Novosphingobium lubricantis]|jgi:hypothetical protein